MNFRDFKSKLKSESRYSYQHLIYDILKPLSIDLRYARDLGVLDKNGIDLVDIDNKDNYIQVIQCKGFEKASFGKASFEQCKKSIKSRWFKFKSATFFEFYLLIFVVRLTSLMILDIDKFKSINDTYGHDVGDIVIINLANYLKQRQRKSDIVSRFGGEEFVILLPNTSLENAKNLAEDIRKDIQNSTLEFNLKSALQYTVSIGVSQIDIKNEKNIESALKRADKALYEAKNNGRNKVCAS
jgi:diguanylate cyclase (GGDEF)-like protein